MFFIRVWFVIKAFILLFGVNLFPEKPASKWELFRHLVGKQVEVLTAFGFVAGKVITVKRDYVVLVDQMQVEVFVRLNKIETVQTISS